MRRTSLARRLGLASATALLAVTAAGCGDSDSSADDTSSETSESSESSESTESESSDPTEDSEETDDSDDSGEADGDLEELSANEFYPEVMEALQEAETFRFRTASGGSAAGGPGSEMEGTARWEDDSIEMQAASTDGAVEMIMIDQVMYMKGAGLTQGDTWMKIDMSDESSPFGALGKSADPSAAIEAMKDPKAFTLVGTEDVEGVEANHYSITVESKKFAAAMGLPPQAASMLPPEFTTDMWVDSENRPVKFSQELEMKNPNGGAPVKTTSEGYYLDFGVDVDIEAPPAGKVTDAPASMG